MDMKAYSQDLRDRVIDLYKKYKYSRAAIGELLKLNRNTVAQWIKRYQESGDYSSKQHCQKGRQIRFNDKEKVLAYLAEYPDAEGIDIRNNVAPDLPMSTFYDALNRIGVTFKKKSRAIKKVMKTTEERI